VEEAKKYEPQLLQDINKDLSENSDLFKQDILNANLLDLRATQTKLDEYFTLRTSLFHSLTLSDSFSSLSLFDSFS